MVAPSIGVPIASGYLNSSAERAARVAKYIGIDGAGSTPDSCPGGVDENGDCLGRPAPRGGAPADPADGARPTLAHRALKGPLGGVVGREVFCRLRIVGFRRLDGLSHELVCEDHDAVSNRPGVHEP